MKQEDKSIFGQITGIKTEKLSKNARFFGFTLAAPTGLGLTERKKSGAVGLFGYSP